MNWQDFAHGGELDFVSAGRQNRDYYSSVAQVDWDNFYERLGGGQFFNALRADMKANYDYTLIDSRTGLSDIADICTVHLPDILVDCFTLNNQSIDGASNVARVIDQRYHDRNIRILPVPMRIEEGEKDKLDVGRRLARRRFDQFPQGHDPGAVGRVLGFGRDPLPALLRVRGAAGDVRREPGIAADAAGLVRAADLGDHRGAGHRDEADERGYPAAVP